MWGHDIGTRLGIFTLYIIGPETKYRNIILYFFINSNAYTDKTIIYVRHHRVIDDIFKNKRK